MEMIYKVLKAQYVIFMGFFFATKEHSLWVRSETGDYRCSVREQLNAIDELDHLQ